MYNSYSNNTMYYNEDDRFLLAPFILGGLAGGALGYGIATNNTNKGGYYPMYPMYYYPTYPMYQNSNYYYY